MTKKMIKKSLKLFGNINKFKNTHFKKSGVGIGLTSCNQIAKAMGGNIHIESVLNIGTTITVNIKAKPGRCIEDRIQVNNVIQNL